MQEANPLPQRMVQLTSVQAVLFLLMTWTDPGSATLSLPLDATYSTSRKIARAWIYASGGSFGFLLPPNSFSRYSGRGSITVVRSAWKRFFQAFYKRIAGYHCDLGHRKSFPEEKIKQVVPEPRRVQRFLSSAVLRSWSVLQRAPPPPPPFKRVSW